MFKNKNGFTIIEIMVAFAITAFAFTALMGAFPISLGLNKGAENASIASYLAQGEIESIISEGYNNIATGTVETLHRLSDNTSNYMYYFQRETDISYVDGNLNPSATETGMKKISTSVYYADALKNQKVYTLNLLISQR